MNRFLAYFIALALLAALCCTWCGCEYRPLAVGQPEQVDELDPVPAVPADASVVVKQRDLGAEIDSLRVLNSKAETAVREVIDLQGRMLTQIEKQNARITELENRPVCCPIPKANVADKSSTGCGCCANCTGGPGCKCGCDKCTCNAKQSRYQTILITQPGCVPCEALKRTALQGIDYTESDDNVRWGVNSTPYIVVFDPVKNQFSKFNAGGMDAASVKAGIERAIGKLESPDEPKRRLLGGRL